MKKKVYFLSLFLLFSYYGGVAASLDSLKVVLEYKKSPPNRLSTLLEITELIYLTDPEQAVIYGEEAAQLAKSLNAIEEEAQSQFLLAYIYYFNGQAEKGITAGHTTTRLATQIDNYQLKADSYYILGCHYYTIGQVEKAKEAYQTCLDIGEVNNYVGAISKGSKGLGDLSENNGDYQQAIEHYRHCLKLGMTHNRKRDVKISYNDLGRIYDQMGYYDQGLKYYFKGLELAEKEQDNHLAAALTANISSVHFFQKNYGKAMEYAVNGRSLFEANKDQNGIAKTVQTMGNILFNQGKYDEALVKFEEALKIQEKRNNKRGLSFIYFNLAKTFLKQGDRKKGLDWHLKSLQLREELNFQLGITGSSLVIGNIYLNDSNFSKALPYFQRSLALARETGALQEMSDAYSALANCYAQMGDYEKAYNHQTYDRETRDSLFNQDRNQTIANMQIRYETERKEDKISSLEQKATLNAGIRKKDQQIKSLLGVGLAFLLGLVFLFWNRSQLKQKANTLLKGKNEEIALKSEALTISLQEKEVLLREVHHRVKNNLQMVSSLLNLQASKVEDETILASIREGKGRVEAMSLIHENLYRSDQIKEVEIESYLEQLLRHLDQAFTHEGKSIKLELHAQGIRFNIDTAIPIGLVINELVTNAYKYAFTKQDIGKVIVRLTHIEEETYELRVTDNGSGMPADFDIKKSNSLGLKLVNMLATLQLQGRIKYQCQNGSDFSIHFKHLRSLPVKIA